MTRLRPLILVLWLVALARAEAQGLPEPVVPANGAGSTAPMPPDPPSGSSPLPSSAGPAPVRREALPEAVPGILPHVGPSTPTQRMPYSIPRYQPTAAPGTQYAVPGYLPMGTAPVASPPQPGSLLRQVQAVSNAPGTPAVGMAPPPATPVQAPMLPADPGLTAVSPVPAPFVPNGGTQLTGIVEQPERPPMAWIQFDTLLWWIKNGPNPPPLITTGPLTSALPGALSDSSTQILYGGTNSISYAGFLGGRLTAGMWLTYDQTIGVEGSGFLLEHKVVGYSTSSDSDGNPVISRPFHNTITGAEDVVAVALPGAQYGSIAVASTSGLGGAELNLFAPLMKEGSFQLQGRVGARYLNLTERMSITEESGTTAQLAGLAPLYFEGSPAVDYPGVVTTVDSFETRNNFYGAQAGFTAQWTYDLLSIKVQGEVALGDMHQRLDINGETLQLTGIGGSVVATAPGGILALPSNSGVFTRDRLGVVPGFDLQAKYQLFPNLAVQLGYNFVYVNNVIRPGNQIDRSVNPSQSPALGSFGTAPVTDNPAVQFNSVNFWAQGINLGVQLSY